MTEEKERAAIVVGLDGSGLGGVALDWATAEAARRGARVVAITVHARGADLDAAVEQLERAARNHPGVTVAHERRTGPVAETLVTAAADASMLVIGSRGAVAATCVRHARVPVVVLPERSPDSGPPL